MKWTRERAMKILKKRYQMKNFLIILIFNIISAVFLAEVIKNIRLMANERISDETIKVYGIFL